MDKDYNEEMERETVDQQQVHDVPAEGADPIPVDDARKDQREEKPVDDAPRFSLLLLLQPDAIRHRVIATSNTTIEELSNTIASDLKLTQHYISFPTLESTTGNDISKLPLSEFGLNEDTAITRTLEVSISKRTCETDYVMPNQISVHILDEEENIRTITVDVEKFSGRKPYLGGFRHRLTEQIFHHASCQTVVSRARREYKTPRSHRDTQTQELVTRSQQTKRESGTQMARKDLVISSAGDRNIYVKSYFDSDLLDSVKEDAVLLIQRMWRGYKSRSYVLSIGENHRRHEEINALEKHENTLDDAEYQKRQVERRLHPKKTSDFEVLYNELTKWRQIEVGKVNQSMQLSSEERQKAMEDILAKETHLLQTIDRLKLSANNTNRKQRIDSMLRFLSRPKQWQMSDGTIKEVHTPFTVRAEELMQLYNGLKRVLSSVDERLDLLLNIKWTVQEFDSGLTREIIELIDREADMLSRGRKEKSLEGLRKRLNNLFLQFIETPDFNPEAATLRFRK